MSRMAFHQIINIQHIRDSADFNVIIHVLYIHEYMQSLLQFEHPKFLAAFKILRIECKKKSEMILRFCETEMKRDG